MKKEEINALISLLDDPDEEVYETIADKILSLGNPVIPNLEEAWENSFNHTLQIRIEQLIHKIQFSNFFHDITKWSRENEADLLEGVMLIAKYQYPDFSEEVVRSEMASLKRDTWLELNDQLTALEKVHVINKVLFEIHGYSGNTRNYHAPQNSYINNVVESKKGSPLTLSIIYILLAQSLDLPIYGVNLPEHFVLVYADPLVSNEDELKVDNMLFYINPFSKGQVFGKAEIDKFLEEVKQPIHESFYLPCSNLEIIQRLIRNLAYSYKKIGDKEKEEELTDLLSKLS